MSCFLACWWLWDRTNRASPSHPRSMGTVTDRPVRWADEAFVGDQAKNMSARPFASEAEMTEPMAAVIHRLHGRGEVHAVTREQRGALKVPDLVAATLWVGGADAGSMRPALPLREPHVRVLRAVHSRRPLRLETVARRTGIAVDRLEVSVLPTLVGLDLLESRSDGLVRSTGAWVPAVRVLTSVELKLRNWRRALHQAFRMQRSVDYSWVVLDSARAEPARRSVGEFRELGVGLATLNAGTREIAVVSRARAVRHLSPWLRDFFAECVLQDVVRSGQIVPQAKVAAVNALS